mmetsp:Transcript_47624/g.123442  ORF Transcript_47624/g.123442 Transcript_47624/m.123442 type:complete len:415 (-) Transcript_47624:902-2146(-)
MGCGSSTVHNASAPVRSPSSRPAKFPQASLDNMSVDGEGKEGGGSTDFYRDTLAVWHQTPQGNSKQTPSFLTATRTGTMRVSSSANFTSIPEMKQKLRYRTVAKLGEGKFGSVKLVMDAASSELFASKKVFANRNNLTESDLVREVSIMCNLHHPNLLDIKRVATYSSDGLEEGFELPRYDFQGITETAVRRRLEEMKAFKNGVVLLTSFAAGGDVRDLLECARDGVLKERLAAAIFLDAIAGLAYLHRKGVAHRDIKPDNILIVCRCEGCQKKDAELKKKSVMSTMNQTVIEENEEIPRDSLNATSKNDEEDRQRKYCLIPKSFRQKVSSIYEGSEKRVGSYHGVLDLRVWKGKTKNDEPVRAEAVSVSKLEKKNIVRLACLPASFFCFLDVTTEFDSHYCRYRKLLLETLSA